MSEGADKVSHTLERMENGLVTASAIQDFADLHQIVDDMALQEALNIAIKCFAKPNIPHAAVREAMVRFQALAFIFRMQGLVYMQIHKGRAGTQENVKKNAYISASEQCHEMAQTLKYLLRENQ